MTVERLKKLAVYTGIFAALSITACLYRAGTKRIVIVDAATTQEMVTIADEDAMEAVPMETEGLLDGEERDALIIPLPQGVGSDGILLEERYMSHALALTIVTKDTGFYETHPCRTDLEMIRQAARVVQPQSVRLVFTLDEFYAAETELTEDGRILIRFRHPSELYQHVIVLDADAGASTQGQEAIEQLAVLVKEHLDREFGGTVRCYLTTQGETEATEERKRMLLTESEADLFIQLNARADMPAQGIACYYNDRFYIRGFGNVALADLLEQHVTQTTGADALGLFPETGDGILNQTRIPSAAVCIGDITEPAQLTQLQDTAWQDKIAHGITEGVREALTVMEEGQ